MTRFRVKVYEKISKTPTLKIDVFKPGITGMVSTVKAIHINNKTQINKFIQACKEAYTEGQIKEI